ncbi:hypothetical protein [Streptomyces sp. NPDC048644]|uniref:hypothetical protein n=1 Tax=Streptomyces sp. NPDC048644 TaxID=3365582 RepID=UPI0037228F02
MTPQQEPQAAVAVELAQLRGEIATGLAEIKGSLAVMASRSERTERDVTALRTDTETELAELRATVEVLQRGRWPLPAVGALTGLAALLLTAYEIAAR